MEMEGFNADMLALARELRGLSQVELSQETGIDQGLISKYECQLRQPSEQDLNRFANALKFPRAFFFREGRIYDPETEVLYYRRKTSVPAKILSRTKSLLNNYRLSLTRLLEVADTEYPYSMPSIKVTEDNTPALIADKVRRLWQLPVGPIPHLISQLENASCFVFSVDFGTENIDAVSQWIEPTPPIILVNFRAPSDRMRFSLAHELGHLIMHHKELPFNDMEDEANEFASAFLLPEKPFSETIAPFSLEHLFEMKSYWKVSAQAMMKRARSLGLITEQKYTNFHKQLSKANYRKEEPFPVPTEMPQLIDTLFNLYRTELNFTTAELQELMNIGADDFKAWFTNARSPQLRIVKHKDNSIKKTG